MPRYPCPSCGAGTFSFWTKQLVGPWRKMRCTVCNSYVSVASGMGFYFVALVGPPIVLVTGVAGAIALADFGGIPIVVGFLMGAVAGTLPFTWIWHRYVPLVKKDA